MAENTIQQMFNSFQSGYSPYGNGSNSQSAIVALGESWAYHMGHYFTDKKYGNRCSNLSDQGIGYANNSPINGLSSHLNLLENFSPYRTNDPFYWVPTGLFYDMLDTRNEQKATGGPVDDNVSGYTNAQMFSAFQSTIYTLQDYRIRLLQTTTNPTSSFVPSLFSQYGY